MKIPRDVSASQLIKLLKELGYQPTRQSGSHIRLSTIINGQHHITIPNHNPIKLGTLSGILQDVATHFGKSKAEIVDILFV
ncbi:MAG: type II toxin-antitoxin system HicA family toxin [Bacteroidia bacterium]